MVKRLVKRPQWLPCAPLHTDGTVGSPGTFGLGVTNIIEVGARGVFTSDGNGGASICQKREIKMSVFHLHVAVTLGSKRAYQLDHPRRLPLSYVLGRSH